MTIPTLHRLLGLAGIYGRLDGLAADVRILATTVSRNGLRLRLQEQAMSNLAPILAGLAASLATITTTQKTEADDVAKISKGIADLLASKPTTDDGSVTITADELTQLQGFGDALATAAESSKARADELDGIVAKLPTKPEAVAAAPEPTGDPVATSPADPTDGIDPSASSTIPDGFSPNA